MLESKLKRIAINLNPGHPVYHWHVLDMITSLDDILHAYIDICKIDTGWERDRERDRERETKFITIHMH